MLIGKYSTLRVAAVSDTRLISVSGRPSELNRLRSQLGSTVSTTFVHVHSWYHGGDDQLGDIMQHVETDIRRRMISFPTCADLKKPLRSSMDAALVQSGPLDLLVIQSLLAGRVDWSRTCQAMLGNAVRFDIYGPGTGCLLAGFQAHCDPTTLQINDVSTANLAKQRPSSSQAEDVAIVGMGVRLPSGNSPDELWQTLLSGLGQLQEVS